MNRDLTVKEAAEKVGMIYQDFIVLIRNNVIPNYKVGNMYLIKEEDLNKWKENKETSVSTI